MRGGTVVSTLTGAFGHSLRETRLTALLGYLIAVEPNQFQELFGFRGLAQSVALETRHDEGRSDILVETTLGTGIIEAKVDAADPLEQSRRYPGQWVALLTHRIPAKRDQARTRYVTWEQLASVLATLRKSRSPRLRVLSTDLLHYLKEHRMITNREPVEIYAREINEPMTLELFLTAGIYGCLYQSRSRLGEALYFTPHFGKLLAIRQPGVRAGVSYIARIESAEHVSTWRDFKAVLRKERGGVWWNRHAELLRRLRAAWSWNRGEQRVFLLLNKPHLVFNPPIDKRNLVGGRGFLGKRFFSFEELFSAWEQSPTGGKKAAPRRRRK